MGVGVHVSAPLAMVQGAACTQEVLVAVRPASEREREGAGGRGGSEEPELEEQGSSEEGSQG